MTVPAERIIRFVIPDPSWHDALKRLAERRGMTLSQYIRYYLEAAVYRELAAMRENRNEGKTP